MRSVLLDTNIIIAMEDTGRELSETLAMLIRESAGSFTFFLHPGQISDINQDRDDRRRGLLLARVRKFKMLDHVPNGSRDLFHEYGWKNNTRNDEIDNLLLLCVKKNIVDYLITEDKGILRKAMASNLADRVMSVSSFISTVLHVAENPDLAYVADLPCHVLQLDDLFFDSLREDYPDFDNWFIEKCSRGQRRCWAIRDNGKLVAVCIYKVEQGEIITLDGFKLIEPALKLCTFKVSDRARGEKIGERLLYAAFKYMASKQLTFVYLTIRSGRQKHLLNLLESFGFARLGVSISNRSDLVYGKYTAPQNEDDQQLEKFAYYKKFFPSFKTDETVGKYLIPIRPEYHERLFPDISTFRYSLFGNDRTLYSSESNTIRKAYLCCSPVKRIEPGDLLLFYRSVDRKSIQVLAVVAEVFRSSDPLDIISKIDNRTVYSYREIDEMVGKSKGGVLILCFDMAKVLNKEVDLLELRNLGISPPQTIQAIENDLFKAIVRVGNG